MEINLLRNYPKSIRNWEERAYKKNDDDMKIAREFGKDFFDGERKHGYGGFTYSPNYWVPVVPDFISQYNLTSNCSVLDVGCAKGFFLHDLSNAVAGITVRGIDISEYAINNCIESMVSKLDIGNAKELPYENNSFDLIVSITTLHNLELDECASALKEVMRVSKRNTFITLDAYKSNEEKKRMESWNLTAKTIMHVDEWKVFFKKVGYTGDYYWFTP